MAFADHPGLVLALAFLALAPVAVFASQGTVVVMAVAGLALALSRSQLGAALRGLANPLSLALIAFLVWAALSSLWAPDPVRSLTLALRCTLLFAAGLICVTAGATMRQSEREIAMRGIAIGGVAMLLLLMVETASHAALTRFFRGMSMTTLVAHTHGAPLGRGATLLTVFCWPALLATARLTGRRLAVLLFIPVPVILCFQWITASTVSIGLGMVAFVLVYAWPRTMLALLFGLFLVSLVAAPLLSPLLADGTNIATGAEYLPLSWQHRIEIWRFAAERATEQPLLGWGFDATRVLGRIAQSTVFPGHNLALHPHNFSLQLWLEMGAAGVVIVSAFGLLLFRRLWRMAEDRATVATAAAALTCYLAYGQISRGAWQNWWLATAWPLATALVIVSPRSPPRHSQSKPAGPTGFRAILGRWT